MTLIGMVPSGVEARKLMINQDYVEAVLRAGGMPVLFPVTADPDRLSALLEEKKIPEKNLIAIEG